MNPITPSPAARAALASAPTSPTPPSSLTGPAGDDAELRGTFQQFVGETFFGQLLQAMRKLTDKPAYFHGGRAEEIFQQRFDQLLAQKLAQSSSAQIAEPMYELFALGRK